MGKIVLPGKEIVVPRVVARPLLPPPPTLSARLQPQYMHWQVGRYKERLTSGPGGLGRGKVWVVDREAEQHNLILNQTYDSLMAQYGFRLGIWAAVGTGSTPPDPTQTGLVNEVARTQTNESGGTGTWSWTRVADGVVDFSVTREFTETQVGGSNLTEWGFAPAQTPTNNLMSRELFRDGLGNPVVLTLDADQRLRVTYKWRVTVGPVVAQDVSIDIANIGVRTGKLFLRKYVSTDAYPWNAFGYYFGDIALMYAMIRGDSIHNGHVLHNADYPPDYNDTGFFWFGYSKSLAYQSYVLGSRMRKTQPVTWLPSEANTTIRLIGLGATGYPMGVKLNAGQEFTKDNLHKLTIGEWTVTWGP